MAPLTAPHLDTARSDVECTAGNGLVDIARLRKSSAWATRAYGTNPISR